MTPYRLDLTRPLKAWCVGDFNLYAAEDAAQALALANANAGPGVYSLADVAPVEPGQLDEKLIGAEMPMACTLRGLLLDAKAPGHLASYE